MSKLKVDQISKATGASPAIFTLPAADGTAGQYLQTDGAGNLTWGTPTASTNSPAFFAYLTADQTVTDNTATKLACDGELFDTASAYDKDTNYRFTVPAGEGGKYVVTTQISYIDGNAGGAVIKTMIYVGGVEKAFAYDDLAPNGYENTVLMLQTILDLSAADYVEAYGLWDMTPGTPAFGGNASSMSSYFSAFKLAGV